MTNPTSGGFRAWSAVPRQPPLTREGRHRAAATEGPELRSADAARTIAAPPRSTATRVDHWTVWDGSGRRTLPKRRCLAGRGTVRSAAVRREQRWLRGVLGFLGRPLLLQRLPGLLHVALLRRLAGHDGPSHSLGTLTADGVARSKTSDEARQVGADMVSRPYGSHYPSTGTLRASSGVWFVPVNPLVRRVVSVRPLAGNAAPVRRRRSVRPGGTAARACRRNPLPDAGSGAGWGGACWGTGGARFGS